MLDSGIRTIGELEAAPFDMVQHYLSQVTIEDDLHHFLQWLWENEVDTQIVSMLRRSKQRAPGIHPSTASKKGVCLLKVYYEYVGASQVGDAHDEKSQLTWDVGTLLHDTYQTWFEQMYGEQFQREVDLKSPDGKIVSKTDGIFGFTNYRFIIEMKSIKEGGNFGWAKVQAMPQEDHVRQAHFYMKLADVPFALIFYMNKNAGEFKEHAIAFNPALWEEIKNEVIDPVILAANKGKTPKASPGWHCRWCHFRHGCPEKGGAEQDVGQDFTGS